MNVLLINPPRSQHNAILDNAPKDALRYVHRKLVGPPLGLITIAAAIEKYHKVTVLDLKGECDIHNDKCNYISIVIEWLEKVNPDVVGVTFIASEYTSGMMIFKTVKQYNPLIVTVAGGLHVSLCPHHFDAPVIDIACRGQASRSFLSILNTLVSGGSLDAIGGILVRRGEHFSPTPADTVPCNAAQDDFVLPGREYLSRWISTYTVGNGKGPVTYLFTSLGCPYKCTFCSIWPQFEGNYFQREIESIVQELKSIPEYPVVRFADANTIVNVGFIEKLFDRIFEEDIRKEFVMDIRVDTVVENPRLIEKCARGGLKVVISGFESFRDTELTGYNKNVNSSKIEDAIKIFNANGIMVRGNYVIPPDYDERDFNELAEFAGRHTCAYAGYTILTPMPGTALYTDQFKNIIDHDLSKYNFFNCVLKTKLPLEQFYKNVGNLWKIRKGNEVI